MTVAIATAPADRQLGHRELVEELHAALQRPFRQLDGWSVRTAGDPALGRVECTRRDPATDTSVVIEAASVDEAARLVWALEEGLRGC